MAASFASQLLALLMILTLWHQVSTFELSGWQSSLATLTPQQVRFPGLACEADDLVWSDFNLKDEDIVLSGDSANQMLLFRVLVPGGVCLTIPRPSFAAFGGDLLPVDKGNY